jgi:hypothetical protein
MRQAVCIMAADSIRDSHPESPQPKFAGTFTKWDEAAA